MAAEDCATDIKGLGDTKLSLSNTNLEENEIKQHDNTNHTSAPRLEQVKKPALWMLDFDMSCFCNEEDDKHVENPEV